MGQLQNDLLMGIARPALAMGGNLKGLGQQGVAGEDGNAFPENFMAGEFAAPIVVVVHSGKVVVDERIGVNTFDGAGQGQGVGFISATCGRGGEAKSRPHAFAAGEEGIAHRPVDGGRLGLLRGQKPIEGAIDCAGASRKEICQIKSCCREELSARVHQCCQKICADVLGKGNLWRKRFHRNNLLTSRQFNFVTRSFQIRDVQGRNWESMKKALESS